MRILLYCFIIAILFLAGCGTAQQLISTPANNQIVKTKNGSEMLLGNCTRICLLQIPFSDWFVKNYNEYLVDSSLVPELNKRLKKKNITIFLGTWCGDSRREVPRMLKILDAADLNEKQINLIMVSNEDGMYKQSPQHEEKGMNIIRVPTLILSDGKNEIGRIIEFPKKSLEIDLLDILNKNNYIPNYATGQVKS